MLAYNIDHSVDTALFGNQPASSNIEAGASYLDKCNFQMDIDKADKLKEEISSDYEITTYTNKAAFSIIKKHYKNLHESNHCQHTDNILEDKDGNKILALGTYNIISMGKHLNDMPEGELYMLIGYLNDNYQILNTLKGKNNLIFGINKSGEIKPRGLYSSNAGHIQMKQIEEFYLPLEELSKEEIDKMTEDEISKIPILRTMLTLIWELNNGGINMNRLLQNKTFRHCGKIYRTKNNLIKKPPIEKLSKVLKSYFSSSIAL